MIFVHVDKITIPENRFRREFDEKKLEELKQSILRNGLIHPPVVEPNGEAWILRAGERRLKVLKAALAEGHKLYVGKHDFSAPLVPVLETRELTDLSKLEIEIEENVVRSDFTWQERNRALAALHELRKKQNPEQTVAATASEVLGRPAVGSQRMVVSDALIINRYMHIPEVANAKTEKDAIRAIQKIATAGHTAKLAEAALTQRTPHTLIKGNSLDLLSQLQSRSFDVIVTDPPYGVDADSFGDMAATGHSYEDSKKYFDAILKVFPDEAYRVAKDRAHAYVFCDVRRFDQLSTLMLLAGWTIFPTPLIWAKSSGMLPFPDHGPRRTYECILYAWKGDRKTLVVKPDVIDISSVRNPLVGAQKPVALYQDLLSRSANPGDTVLDCFGGSGPVLVASNRLRLTATYIEQDEAAFNIAQSRVHTKEIDDGAEENDGLGDVAV